MRDRKRAQKRAKNHCFPCQSRGLPRLLYPIYLSRSFRLRLLTKSQVSRGESDKRVGSGIAKNSEKHCFLVFSSPSTPLSLFSFPLFFTLGLFQALACCLKSVDGRQRGSKWTCKCSLSSPSYLTLGAVHAHSLHAGPFFELVLSTCGLFGVH